MVAANRIWLKYCQKNMAYHITIWTIYNGTTIQKHMGQNVLLMNEKSFSKIFYKKMLGLLKVYIMHGVGSVLKMPTKYIL